MPFPELSVLTWALSILAVLIQGISKGGFGGGAGMAAVPLMSIAMEPAHAAAVLLPLMLLMDGVGLRNYFGSWDKAAVSALLPGTMIGIALGGFAFSFFHPDLVRLILGIITTLFCIDYWRPKRALTEAAAPPSRLFGTTMGIAGGFTSTVAHAGSPPANFYLLPLKLETKVYVSTMILVFSVVNLVKLIPYVTIGLFTEHTLTFSLFLAPLSVFAMYTGIWLHRRMSREQFYRIAYFLVFLTGLKLLYDGASYLITT